MLRHSFGMTLNNHTHNLTLKNHPILNKPLGVIREHPAPNPRQLANNNQARIRQHRSAKARVVHAAEADKLVRGGGAAVHEIVRAHLGCGLDHEDAGEEGAAGDVVFAPPVVGLDVLVADHDLAFWVEVDQAVDHLEAAALAEYFEYGFLGDSGLSEVVVVEVDEWGGSHGEGRGGGIGRWANGSVIV
jgi:hypothetical protein